MSAPLTGSGVDPFAGAFDSNQQDTTALMNSQTPELDTAQQLAARPTQAAAPLNWRRINENKDPADRAEALQGYQRNLTEPQALADASTKAQGGA